MKNGTTNIRTKQICRVTLLGMFVNALLFAFKLVAGIVGRSGAMIADAAHSASDFATDIVVLGFVRISSKPRDDDHKWGHGKYETLASLIIGIALFGVGVEFLMDSAEKIKAVSNGEVLPRPGVIAIIAAAVSVVTKEALYQWTIRKGKALNSPSVVANAWHHRSDALSSIGALIGIGLAYFLGEEWRIADPIAAIVVAALIIKVAIELCRAALAELLEKSLPRAVEEEILLIVSSVPNVHDPHNLRTRRIGADIAIEIHIRVEGTMTVFDSHEISKEIERALRERYGEQTAVAIHIEPLKRK
jgi:cation diffusion facilitator family transporter